MMNKKGQDWLNVMEFFVLIFCIFFTFLFLNLATISSEEKAELHLAEFRAEYQNTQVMRIFLQSPIEINDNKISVSQAINEYYEFLYLENDVDSLSIQERQAYYIKKNTYEKAFRELAENYILTHLSAPRHQETYLYIYYEINGNPIPSLSLVLGEVVDYSGNNKVPFNEVNLMIPLYFDKSSHLPGTYTAYLGFSKSNSKNNFGDI